MSQPSVTPRLDALRNEMSPQQRANFDKMLNHQPRLKKMYNATMKTATEAWDSQPGIRVRLAAMEAASAGRTAAGAVGTAGRATTNAVGTAARVTQTAVMNPGQTYENARDAGGRALNASLDAGGRALNAAGRGMAAGAAATGRGIANSRVGRWVADTWSRGTAAAEAGRRAFNEGRANPGTPNVSAKDQADLSARAVAVVAAQSPEDRLAATQALITELQTQIDKSNAGFGNAQAPAAQAVQASAATTGPQQGAQQGAGQGAQQGERAQQPDNKKGPNGGVQR